MSRVEHLAEGVTLYLGDCLEVLPTLGKFDALVTDPPYGIGQDGGRGHRKRSNARVQEKEELGSRAPFGGSLRPIEIDPGYFDIACRRIAAALKEPDLFIEAPQPMKQEALPL